MSSEPLKTNSMIQMRDRTPPIPSKHEGIRALPTEAPQFEVQKCTLQFQVSNAFYLKAIENKPWTFSRKIIRGDEVTTESFHRKKKYF